MNAKKIFASLIAAVVCSVALVAAASAEVLDTDVAKIGDEGYETLKAAVESVTDDTYTEIELLCDASGDGIEIKEGRDIVIDLGGNTYTINGALVGSKGTETIGFQLHKNSTVTIKDGAIEADVEAIEANQTNIDNGDKTLKMLIQNYADLTLEDVILDMSDVENCLYVLSNNCGDTVIDGATEIVASEGNIALDVYYSKSYSSGVSVTIADTMTGEITGTVVYDAAGNEDKAAFTNESDVEVEVSVYNEDDEIIDSVAKIGDTYYATLKAAVEAADGDTVELLCDASGDGIIIAEGQEVEIDLGGYTYTVDGTLVGSTGTKSNGFQLLKDSKVTFTNGAIVASADAVRGDGKDTGIAILIQNYGDLTLTDVTVDASGAASCWYAVSNNYGDTVFEGDTSIIAAEDMYAFDVYYTDGTYGDGLSVTVGEGVKIDGMVVYDAAENEDKAALVNNSGEALEVYPTEGATTKSVAKLGDTYYATLAEAAAGLSEGDVVEIVGEVTDEDLANAKAALAEGLSFEATPMDTYTVTKAVAQKLTVRYDNKTPEGETEYLLYDIVLVAEAYEINRLNSADLKFTHTVTEGAVKYEIIESNGEIAINNPVAGDVDRYEFHYKDKDSDVTTDTAKEVIIGQVKFSGFGKFDFAIAEADTNAVHATKMLNSIVDSFAPDGELDGKKVNELDISAKPEVMEIEVPTEALTINVTFPNNVKTDNETDYQSMKVTISGGDLAEDVVIELGKDSVITGVEEDADADVEKVVVTENSEVSYKIEINELLILNRTYNVKIEGEGYRTSYATVKMTTEKTLNFWNNVKDNGEEIEEGSGNEVQTSFLAGDIVANGIIDIYDLSAVVSYFGEEDIAKYDLNRDGVIDSKDVAYVLVSWGK